MRKPGRYLLLLSASLALSAAAWSQDSGNAEPADGDDAANQAESEDPAAVQDEGEEVVVDDESYIDIEEEDFRPSEEIDADQSIPFPTDI